MSDDWRDIVRLLREAARHPYMDNTCKMNVFDAAKAADEIDRLRAELAQVKIEVAIEINHLLKKIEKRETVVNLALEAFGALKKVRATNVKGKPVGYKTLENIDSIIVELEAVFAIRETCDG